MMLILLLFFVIHMHSKMDCSFYTRNENFTKKFLVVTSKLMIIKV
uniref:Uncharacterized protein n=1 Tax=Setaria viridis TaxID=4556 RepID=A0A4U6TPW6_SETVI|nr:hypothetical protein SEVIR_7G077066v2 [Setaria viridis]